MLLSNGSSVKITMDGIDWIEARFTSFSALDSDSSNMFMIDGDFPHEIG